MKFSQGKPEPPQDGGAGELNRRSLFFIAMEAVDLLTVYELIRFGDPCY